MKLYNFRKAYGESGRSLQGRSGQWRTSFGSTILLIFCLACSPKDDALESNRNTGSIHSPDDARSPNKPQGPIDTSPWDQGDAQAEVVPDVETVQGTYVWQQLRGPSRDGRSSESGLLNKWPSEGPNLIWSYDKLGKGFGSVVMNKETLFVQGTEGDESVVFALSREEGEFLWSTAIDKPFVSTQTNGPNSTPTINDNTIYALSGNGTLASLNIFDGSIIWKIDLAARFGASAPMFGFAESPLVHGNLIYLAPGGPEGSVVALNKDTGDTVWVCRDLRDQASYASFLLSSLGDHSILMGFTAEAAVGISATDGALLWRYEKVANKTANAAMPVLYKNAVFYTSNYEGGGALLQLNEVGDRIAVSEIYSSKTMRNHFGGIVRDGDFVYGSHNAIFRCVRLQDGRRIWENRSVGKGSVTYADGKIYILGEGGEVALINASPEGYQESSRFSLPQSTGASIAIPVVCGARLYLRSQETLYSFDIGMKD